MTMDDGFKKGLWSQKSLAVRMEPVKSYFSQSASAGGQAMAW